MAISPSTDVANTERVEKRSLGTSLIGLALGTGVAAISQTDPSLRWLGILAPGLAVVGDQISALIRHEFLMWWHRQRVDKTRSQINDYLGNPHTSDEHKENLKRTLETIEMEGVRATANTFTNTPIFGESANAKGAKPASLPKSGPKGSSTA